MLVLSNRNGHCLFRLKMEIHISRSASKLQHDRCPTVIFLYLSSVPCHFVVLFTRLVCFCAAMFDFALNIHLSKSTDFLKSIYFKVFFSPNMYVCDTLSLLDWNIFDSCVYICIYVCMCVCVLAI